jgi:hypothetical protein
MDSMVASMNRKRALRKDDRARLAETVESLALELYAARRSGDSGTLRLSRRKANYEAGRRNRYNASAVTHNNACRVADWLVSEGYAGTKKGHYRRYPGFGSEAGAGEQSRIWATERLVSFLEREHGLTPQCVGFASWVETVVLRDKSEDGQKLDIEYSDTSETRRMRSNLAYVATQLSRYQISQAATTGAYEDIRPFRLVRIFSRGSFDLGGRFYHGPWIEMPPEDRARLLIDGEEVVELDYSALHPRLIYMFEGKPLDASEDPYELAGWESKELRGCVKLAFQQLLNSKPATKLRKPRAVHGQELPKGGWTRLLTDLETKHASIRGWFRTGRGLNLQRVDSDIAERVLLALLRKGICCLPIHDSFVVPASSRDALADEMEKALQNAMKHWARIELRTA